MTIEKEVWRFYDCAKETITATDAEKEGAKVLLHQLEAEVAPYGSIETTLCSSRIVGENLEVTLRAECRESIGELTPILVE